MKFRIEDSIVDTEKAAFEVSLASIPCGYGHDRPHLCRSHRGRWYLVHDYSWCEDGRQLDYAEWLSPQEAARLALLNEIDVSAFKELLQAVEQVSE